MTFEYWLVYENNRWNKLRVYHPGVDPRKFWANWTPYTTLDCEIAQKKRIKYIQLKVYHVYQKLDVAPHTFRSEMVESKDTTWIFRWMLIKFGTPNSCFNWNLPDSTVLAKRPEPRLMGCNKVVASPMVALPVTIRNDSVKGESPSFSSSHFQIKKTKKKTRDLWQSLQSCFFLCHFFSVTPKFI